MPVNRRGDRERMKGEPLEISSYQFYASGQKTRAAAESCNTSRNHSPKSALDHGFWLSNGKKPAFTTFWQNSVRIY